MKKPVKEVLKKRKVDIPITEFQQQFNDEDACRNYLFKFRWPNGFICSNCGHTGYYFVKQRHLYQCAHCKKQHG